MTDDNLKRRVEQLEEEVKELGELRSLVEALRLKVKDQTDGGEGALAELDRFDRPVVERAEVLDGDPSPNQLVSWYREAGIHDTAKVKRRVKSLRQRGYL